MKRLLLGPALIAPLALFGCSNWGTKVPELPKVEVPTEVVGSVSSAARQIPLEDFEHFPPAIVPAVPPAPTKKRTHAHSPHSHAAHAQPTRQPVRVPVPQGRPHRAADPVEPLPPQQGPLCIFPLNMIPNCTPQVAE